MRLKNLAMTLLVAVAGTVSASAQTARAEVSPYASTQANYGHLPLTFEANRGQVSPNVKFVSRGPGYTAFLTSSGMVLSLRASHALTNNPAGSRTKKATLQFQLVGAAQNSTAIGEQQQQGRVNYFVGNDPSKWQRNVPTYAQVRFKNVYPGIDLLYYGNHRQLEYDFTVAPGANPERIQFKVSGASSMSVDAAGNLVLTTSNGELHFQAPTVYQESNGQRIPVSGGYVVNDPTHVSFRLAKYDVNQSLLIDPVLVYSTYLGGSGDDQTAGIAVDKSGNVYVTGSTDSTDFPLSNLGSLPAGNTHVFVAELDSTGSNLIYADYLGGNNEDYGYALALDADDNVYVTGSTASSNFPMVNPFQGVYPGAFNAFLTKISADGSSLLYSTYFGGNGSDIPSSLAVDAAGNMLIAGYTSSTNLPVASAYQSTVSPNQGSLYGNYGFLTKFSADGSALIYSTYLAGNSNLSFACGVNQCWPEPENTIAGMALDSSGDAYVTGSTNTYNFPVTNGAYLTTNTAPSDRSVGFVSKFSSAGSLQYSTYFYDPNGLAQVNTAIAVDSSGSAYITGIALSGGTFPITTTSICDPSVYGSACNYAFVTKFDSAGATLLYSTFLGPNNNATPQAIALDENNDAYVLAFTGSGSFSTVNGFENYSSGNDVLLVEIDPIASTQLFATYLGGSGDDQPAPAGMALDASGNLYITGMTDSTDLPVTQSAFQSVPAGNSDGFIVKIANESAPAVLLNPVSLQYASQTIGTSSQPQTVLLRNMGSASLAISSVTGNADFSEADNCGTSVPAAGSCTLSVTFNPVGPGARNGALVIHDDAAGSPHSISLSGSGVGPYAALSPASLTFSSIPVGTSSTAQTVMLANTGDLTLAINNIQAAGDYRQTNNCPSSLLAGSRCSINVTFLPTATGSRTGSITISDSASGGAQVVALAGTGANFSLTSSSGSATVKAGASATYTLTVAPVGGAFTNAVKLSCSGAPAKATCTLSSSSVTPGSSPANVTLTLQTAGNSADLRSLRGQAQPVYAAWVQLQGLGLFGMILASAKLRAKKVRILIALFLLVGAMVFMSGCAGGTGIAQQKQSNGTASGTYTITVTGTSGSLQHSVPVTLTVQ